MVDASAFFAALFGSDQMEMFVGKLQMAVMAEGVGDLTRDETDFARPKGCSISD